ncbi:MAG: GNAT family N-acetyltransferase [Candidatus Nanosyncoccus sp.]
MIEVIKLSEYNERISSRIRTLLIQLSRSGKDKGEIPREWFEQIISSPWHDLLLAIEVTNQDEFLKKSSEEDTSVKEWGAVFSADQILGMATVSVVFGAGIGKNAYLEDFVVDNAARGKGIGSLLFQAYEDWAKEKGCKNLEFTCGHGREAAQSFYKTHGAEIYDTNFFRKKLN